MFRITPQPIQANRQSAFQYAAPRLHVWHVTLRHGRAASRCNCYHSDGGTNLSYDRNVDSDELDYLRSDAIDKVMHYLRNYAR